MFPFLFSYCLANPLLSQSVTKPTRVKIDYPATAGK